MNTLFSTQPRAKHIYQILTNRANYQGLVLADITKLKKRIGCTKHTVKKLLRALVAHQYLQAYPHHKNTYLVIKLNQEYHKAEHIMSPHAILHMKRFYKRKIKYLTNNNQYLRASNKHWIRIVKRSNHDNALALRMVHQKDKSADTSAIKTPSFAQDQAEQQKIKEKYQQKRPQDKGRIYTSKNNKLANQEIAQKPDKALDFTDTDDTGGSNSINALVKESNSEINNTQPLASNAIQQASKSTNKSAQASKSSQANAKSSKSTSHKESSNTSNYQNNQMFTL